MYADDTTLYFNLEDFSPEMREAEINAELEKVNVWLKLNKLTLNTNETKLMIFHRKPRHISELNIVINGTQIDRVQLFNFLGITLDDDLSWNGHVKLVKKKISKAIGILYRRKHTFLRNFILIFDSIVHKLQPLIMGFKITKKLKLCKRKPSA